MIPMIRNINGQYAYQKISNLKEILLLTHQIDIRGGKKIYIYTYISSVAKCFQKLDILQIVHCYLVKKIFEATWKFL